MLLPFGVVGNKDENIDAMTFSSVRMRSSRIEIYDSIKGMGWTRLGLQHL